LLVYGLFIFESVLFLRIFIFFFSVIITLNLLLIAGLWFRVIFFFVFVSGLLVLIFYLVSIDFNPTTKTKKKIFFLFSFLIFFFPIKYEVLRIKFLKNFRKNLFCYSE